MADGKRLLVYEKPTCSTCRQVMARLNERGIDYEAIDYTLDPIPRERLRELAEMMGVAPKHLLRRSEPLLKELSLDEESDDEVLDAMAAHPQLVQRPILVYGDRAVLARPPERVDELFVPGGEQEGVH